MTSADSRRFRLEPGARGPRIVAHAWGTEMIVAEFPRAEGPRLSALPGILAGICLAALEGSFSTDATPAEERPSPLELLGLALAACDQADTAFAVLNLSDDITPQARRALCEAWPQVQAAIGAGRGPDSFHAEAARENQVLLRATVAADAVDRYAAALAAGADPVAARSEAVATATRPPVARTDVESVWDLARQCIEGAPSFDSDQAVNGADLVEWFAEMRERLRRALQLLPR